MQAAKALRVLHEYKAPIICIDVNPELGVLYAGCGACPILILRITNPAPRRPYRSEHCEHKQHSGQRKTTVISGTVQ